LVHARGLPGERAGALALGVAGQGAGGQFGKPEVAELLPRVGQHEFDETDVSAQRLDDVGVGRPQPDEQGRLLLRGGPEAAGRAGQPQPAEAGCAEPPDLLVGQPAVMA
jgi:hypothetical protein